ncbi:MAG: sulfite exporter TauE/SafE family protein [Propionibacteriaceae bacterium]|nr:sulfite exporter TauE/SafE family protein [Propionibacteriaceae bacterium]
MADDQPMTAAKRSWPGWLACAGIGLLAGFFSGLFGVGGGTVIVPLLTVAGFDMRKASGTSLAAIVPTAVAGVVSYAVNGWVDWLAAGLIVVGSVAGAQLGSKLLGSLPQRVVRWAFVAFVAAVVVSLFVVVTARDSHMAIDGWLGAGLVLLGLGVGVLSGLLGLGGGIVVVPMLILAFGASDLVAKGTSLAMMTPTAISGTVGNYRRGNVDLAAAAVVGLAACLTTFLGARVAAWVDPAIGNGLFAAFLAFVAVRMARDAMRRND